MCNIKYNKLNHNPSSVYSNTHSIPEAQKHQIQPDEYNGKLKRRNLSNANQDNSNAMAISNIVHAESHEPNEVSLPNFYINQEHTNYSTKHIAENNQTTSSEIRGYVANNENIPGNQLDLFSQALDQIQAPPIHEDNSLKLSSDAKYTYENTEETVEFHTQNKEKERSIYFNKIIASISEEELKILRDIIPESKLPPDEKKYKKYDSEIKNSIIKAVKSTALKPVSAEKYLGLTAGLVSNWVENTKVYIPEKQLELIENIMPQEKLASYKKHGNYNQEIKNIFVKAIKDLFKKNVELTLKNVDKYLSLKKGNVSKWMQDATVINDTQKKELSFFEEKMPKNMFPLYKNKNGRFKKEVKKMILELITSNNLMAKSAAIHFGVEASAISKWKRELNNPPKN